MGRKLKKKEKKYERDEAEKENGKRSKGDYTHQIVPFDCKNCGRSADIC